MKNEISKKKLKKMIASDFTDLSAEEIKALIQKEVDKGPDEIDTDYIDLCFELLSIKNNSTNKRKIKLTKSAKVLLAAAVLMVVFISTITVSAQFNLNIPEKIVQLINGNAEIDYNLENADTTADGYALLDTDLAKQIADYGITPVTLPEEMTKENCKVIQIEDVSVDETWKIISVDFYYNNQKGWLRVEQMSEELETAGVSTVMDIKSGQMININGMDIIMFEQDNRCSIIYKDNLTTYEISLDCNLETAIKIADSIK
ncbi:MAG: DUF4367 domain-containing protein [Candidatus Gastranaerophilaceae bacterium]